MKILSLVGARPQFVKEAGIGSSFREMGNVEYILVHSGQHYDVNMSDIFFEELSIKPAEINLGIGSSSHAKQTADVLVSFEKVLYENKPDLVLVYGDTNTTLAGALAASKLKIPVAHVEAGIRQEPRDMPEEINRVLTDHISSLLYCCSDLSSENLLKEGINQGVHIAGDIMLDVYLRMEPKFDKTKALSKYNLNEGSYIVFTLHRDFNVDNREVLANILEGINRIQKHSGLKILLPLHPRTRKRINEFNLNEKIKDINVVDPLGYLDLMSLVKGCAFVITDSGGLQKEAYFAGKRAMVLMPDTGWKELVLSGWNMLSRTDPESILKASKEISVNMYYPSNIYGTGNTSDIIVRSITEYLS
jgi:UDP-N-acetylglucosamine 2-epimerase (non-hydrolysing)